MQNFGGGVVNHDHEIMRCKLLIVLSGTCTVSESELIEFPFEQRDGECMLYCSVICVQTINCGTHMYVVPDTCPL